MKSTRFGSGSFKFKARSALALGLSFVLALGGLPTSALAEAIEEATTSDVATNQQTMDDGLSVLHDDGNTEMGTDGESIGDAEELDIEPDSDVAIDVPDNEQAIEDGAAKESLEEETTEDDTVAEETASIAEEKTSEKGEQGITAASEDHDVALEAMASKPTLMIGNKSYTAKASGKGSGGGTWSWNGASSLTLDGYRGGAIYYGGGSVTITLKGTNRITSLARWTDANGSVYSVCADDGSITLRGTGSLTLAPTASAASADDLAYGVMAKSLTVDGTTLTVDFSSITSVGHLRLFGVNGLYVKNGSKVVGRACGCSPVTSSVLYEMIDKASISDSTFILDYTKTEYVRNSITLACWSGLNITNSIVKVSGGGGIDGGTMQVTNSDITSSILVTAMSFTLKQVKSAKVVDNEFFWGASMRLDSDGSDTVNLTHTGAASAYANGVQDVRTSISKASVAKVANQAWTGKAIKPSPKVTIGGKPLNKGTDYTLSYADNTKAGTATITVTGKGSYTGTKTVTFKIMKPSVSYYVHRQTYGWEDAWSKKDGVQSGTTGQSKRLEGIKIRLTNKPVTGSIQYCTHIQTYGWETSWREDGAMSGTTGQAKRLEAIRIRLTGNMKNKYDVYYRVHAQHFGWMGWAKNGASAGTAGYAYRLEAIQVVLVPKGGSAPGTTYKGATRTTVAAFKDKNASITMKGDGWKIVLPEYWRGKTKVSGDNVLTTSTVSDIAVLYADDIELDYSASDIIVPEVYEKVGTATLKDGTKRTIYRMEEGTYTFYAKVKGRKYVEVTTRHFKAWPVIHSPYYMMLNDSQISYLGTLQTLGNGTYTSSTSDYTVPVKCLQAIASGLTIS